ncbi:LPXTG-motif cell wall anchor domain-containing protein [Pilibacter termitis]|uniref:LPXTG-motif cell wall anchor domain-containing protein n=1 Tax=Pilibacter termitis TaxID=263852 RepID=A0A1T4LFA7_9ENTE|nr:LPXTG cell wall anchor domain-containing protein [Pilibacter termitis]SJZ53350.1 LPXTG-motif cell wall anchor domain-containing protein [Pilibacter termitis]
MKKRLLAGIFICSLLSLFHLTTNVSANESESSITIEVDSSFVTANMENKVKKEKKLPEKSVNMNYKETKQERGNLLNTGERKNSLLLIVGIFALTLSLLVAWKRKVRSAF